MRYVLLCFLACAAASMSAQTAYTDYLRKPVAGKGTVTIVQDAEIEALVNNLSAAAKKENRTPAPAKAEEKAPAAHHLAETAEKPRTAHVARQRRKAQGYRIQIFTGGNSRSDRLEAEKMEAKCQKAFPELSAYVHFVSPRWICRVGDFRTYADAERYLQMIRKSRISHEARIVKCSVLLAY